MTSRFAVSYIDRLLEGDTYDDLVQLYSILSSSPRFTMEAPDHGLPEFAFVFAETVLWFAQAMRSGVWTYYESTPLARQHAMLSALRAHAPDGFADWYERRMTDWEDEQKIVALDDWMQASDEACNAWLRRLARENRDGVLALA